MKGIVFVFALLSLAFCTAHAITVGNCPDGTQYGKCSTANPGSYCTGSISAPTLQIYVSKCSCEAVPGWMQDGTGDNAVCIQAKCADGTSNGQCSSVTKPKVCVGGNTYFDNSTKCGCPAGKRVAANGLSCEFIPCNDGGISVPEGTCSAKKGKKCVNGVLVDKASECGCPTGKTMVGDACGVVCTDGTSDGSCSATKPKQCVNGYLIDNAEECGCPNGQNAVGKQCTTSIFGGSGGASLLDETGNNSQQTGRGANALSCCCLPIALIGIVGGFTFFRKR
jgi:hypothetical protein